MVPASDPHAFAPPGHLPDFDPIPGQRAQWSAAMHGAFKAAIKARIKPSDEHPSQYYDPLSATAPAGPVLRQAIVWNAFPGTLRRRWGREAAFRLADHPLPLSLSMEVPGRAWQPAWGESLFYRPQDEYCEWRVDRTPAGEIKRVTFTSEPPEYWSALHGDPLDFGSGESFPFPGDRDALLRLYRKYVSPAVELADLQWPEDVYEAGGELLAKAGTYNQWNRWNTTDGIMHLTHPANSVNAEIVLAADASILRKSGKRQIFDADTLIARAKLGGNNRCSDPTISATVNHLAALGYGVSLANPVGLYMDHLDMTGWTLRGEPVDSEWFRVERGTSELIERAVFEVPADEGLVSDIEIAGEPVRHGGQLAERITVKLIALAAIGAGFATEPRAVRAGAVVEIDNPWMVKSRDYGWPVPLDAQPAFQYGEALTAARAVELVSSADDPPPSPRAA